MRLLKHSFTKQKVNKELSDNLQTLDSNLSSDINKIWKNAKDVLNKIMEEKLISSTTEKLDIRERYIGALFDDIRANQTMQNNKSPIRKYWSIFEIFITKIYDTSKIPNEWLKSIFILLTKNPNPR